VSRGNTQTPEITPGIIHHVHGQHQYAHSSIIVTSNVPFDQWGRIFCDDEVIAAAILDRLLHYSEVFPITGPSYRLRGKLAQ
jgi:DNA replication protein DnaC